jgi:hypothetical protein
MEPVILLIISFVLFSVTAVLSVKVIEMGFDHKGGFFTSVMYFMFTSLLIVLCFFSLMGTILGVGAIIEMFV